MQNAEASLPSVSVIQDIMMLDTNASLLGLTNQDVTMQDPDVPYPELHSMPGPSSDVNMQQSTFSELPFHFWTLCSLGQGKD